MALNLTFWSSFSDAEREGKKSPAVKKQNKELRAKGFRLVYSNSHYKNLFRQNPKSSSIVSENLKRKKRVKDAIDSGQMRPLKLSENARRVSYRNEKSYQRSLRHFFIHKGLEHSRLIAFKILDTEESVTSPDAEKVVIPYYDIVKTAYSRPTTMGERSGIATIEMANGIKYRLEGNQKIVQMWGGKEFRPEHFVLAKNLLQIDIKKDPKRINNSKR